MGPRELVAGSPGSLNALAGAAGGRAAGGAAGGWGCGGRMVVGGGRVCVWVVVV